MARRVHRIVVYIDDELNEKLERVKSKYGVPVSTALYTLAKLYLENIYPLNAREKQGVKQDARVSGR